MTESPTLSRRQHRILTADQEPAAELTALIESARLKRLPTARFWSFFDLSRMYTVETDHRGPPLFQRGTEPLFVAVFTSPSSVRGALGSLGWQRILGVEFRRLQPATPRLIIDPGSPAALEIDLGGAPRLSRVATRGQRPEPRVVLFPVPQPPAPLRNRQRP